VISARPADAEDLTRISALARLGIEELRPGRGGAVWALANARPEPIESSLRAAIESPESQVLVGEISGAVVGYSVTRMAVLRDGSRLAVLEDIYVHPEARAVSVGEAMVEQVIKWATEHGCLGIDSMALPGDRNTKNFFETFGFRARAIVVHRPIDGSPEPEE
jgi:GNAT superfamily N-acetyltransferase